MNRVIIGASHHTLSDKSLKKGKKDTKKSLELCTLWQGDARGLHPRATIPHLVLPSTLKNTRVFLSFPVVTVKADSPFTLTWWPVGADDSVAVLAAKRRLSRVTTQPVRPLWRQVPCNILHRAARSLTQHLYSRRYAASKQRISPLLLYSVTPQALYKNTDQEPNEHILGLWTTYLKQWNRFYTALQSWRLFSIRSWFESYEMKLKRM